MAQALTLRLMNEEEAARLVGWAADEGWNPGLHDASIFWQTDPEAFIAAEIEGKVIGGGTIVSHDGVITIDNEAAAAATARGTTPTTSATSTVALARSPISSGSWVPPTGTAWRSTPTW